MRTRHDIVRIRCEVHVAGRALLQGTRAGRVVIGRKLMAKLKYAQLPGASEKRLESFTIMARPS